MRIFIANLRGALTWNPEECKERFFADLFSGVVTWFCSPCGILCLTSCLYSREIVSLLSAVCVAGESLLSLFHSFVVAGTRNGFFFFQENPSFSMLITRAGNFAADIHNRNLLANVACQHILLCRKSRNCFLQIQESVFVVEVTTGPLTAFRHIDEL